MGKNVFVTKSKEGDQWSVKTEGSEKAYRNFNTQKEAIAIGKGVAQNNQSELTILGKDGKIREKNSYGPDKFPPKG